jgi:hypothetical protein
LEQDGELVMSKVTAFKPVSSSDLTAAVMFRPGLGKTIALAVVSRFMPVSLLLEDHLNALRPDWLMPAGK